MSTLNENKRKLTSIRGMGAALVGFAGWIILYVVFGLIEPNIFTTNNMLNLLRSMAKEVVASSENILADYRSGNKKAFQALVGQMMKRTKGKGNPALIQKLLKEEIGE